jgi:hypothetical protein
VGLRPVAASRRLTTAERGGSTHGPPQWGQAKQSFLPAAVEATTRMTYRQCSDAVTRGRAIAFTRRTPGRWGVQDRSARSLSVSIASSRDFGRQSSSHSRTARGSGSDCCLPRHHGRCLASRRSQAFCPISRSGVSGSAARQLVAPSTGRRRKSALCRSLWL